MPPAAWLTQGTRENLLIDWVVKSGAITSLTGLEPTYDIADKDTGFFYYRYALANNIGMTQYCDVDTSTSPSDSPSEGNMWLPGHYFIWAKLTMGLGNEQPRVGHFEFLVLP